MDEREIVVFIYLPGETVAVPAGIFTHDGDSGIGTFAYGRRYVECHNALSVDPIALPLGVIPREMTGNGGLYGAFRDSTPDYWGRFVIAADAGVPPEALSEIDFLLAANATRVGNLDFRSSPDDHPRNHGFLLDGGKMSLSPAYDIVPTPARFGCRDGISSYHVGGRAGQGSNPRKCIEPLCQIRAFNGTCPGHCTGISGNCQWVA